MSARERPWILYGAGGGAVLGAVMGAWTLSSHGPENTLAQSSTIEPEALNSCPDGYVRATGFGPRDLLQGTSAHWLARCDPREAHGTVSASLELLWSPDVQLDPRARGATLTSFVRSVAQSGHLVLEPLEAPTLVTLEGAPALRLDVDAAFRVPPMAARAWMLLAGPHTVMAFLVSPRDRLDTVAPSVESRFGEVRGVVAWDAGMPAVGAPWSVEAACPPGFNDATTDSPLGALGGFHVARHCLAPGDDGGLELTYVELGGRDATEASVRQVFDLAARTMGGANGGFATLAPFTVGTLSGTTSRMDLDPPPVLLHLRATMLPASDATMFAVATSERDLATPTSEALDQWTHASGRVHAYDPALLSNYKFNRALRGILFPALFTAALTALLTHLWRRGYLKLGP